MVYLSLIKKVLPYAVLLIVTSLGCLFFTATMNLSATVSDSSEPPSNFPPLPPAAIPVPDYDESAWCTRVGERHPENPFSGWPVSDPTLQQVTYITNYFCDATYDFDWEHEGLDFAYILGTPVVATGNAFVSQAGYDELTGNTVTLCSGNWCARYFHLSEVAAIAVGDEVARGTLIGFVGNTGTYTTGAHLHYDIYNADGFWDPYETLG